MNNKKLELLSLLSYGFTEELFKEKIGSGSELRELEDGKEIEKDGDLYRVKEVEKFRNKIEENEKKAFLNDVIENFYKPKIGSIDEVDFSKLLKNYSILIQLYSAYFNLKEYDFAIESIFKYAKKMIYWGFKDHLKIWLENFEDRMISDKNQKWKDYYLAFSDIMVGYNFNTDYKNIENIFNKYEFNDNDELSLEMRNLKAIYYRMHLKKVEKAIELHKENIKILNEENVVENIDIHIGRSYENLSLCYINSNLEKSIKIAKKAEAYLLKANDNYELSKLYYNILNLYIKQEGKLDEIFKYFRLCANIVQEFDYPDISRNVINLFSDYCIKEYCDFDQYFRLKTQVLNDDSILYSEYFASDFISIVRTIRRNSDKNIVSYMNPLINYLEKSEYTDEYYFMKSVKLSIENKPHKSVLSKIKNASLKNLFIEVFGKK